MLTFQTKNKSCEWSGFAKSQIPREPAARSRNQPWPLAPRHHLPLAPWHSKPGTGPARGPCSQPSAQGQPLSAHTQWGDGVGDSICRGQNLSQGTGLCIRGERSLNPEI